MRAVLLTDYGRAPELTDAPDPTPAANELLVRVHSSSVNGVDMAVAAGMLKDMMEFGPPITLGRDFSGVVEQVGAEVERYGVGDEVYGFRHNPVALDGVWAEYIAEPEDMFLSAKPANLDFTQSGALPLAGVTALLAVDAIEPSHGEVVLVVGATGGVGGFAVELAAARGATVLATTKPGDEDRLRRLGASDVIDYTREDLTGAVRERHPEGVQGLVDALSFAEAFGARAELLAAGGRAASTLGAADVDSARRTGAVGDQRVGCARAGASRPARRARRRRRSHGLDRQGLFVPRSAESARQLSPRKARQDRALGRERLTEG
jgi:NADPH:quinone reductase-like Zn-dependent oxidoreductase